MEVSHLCRGDQLGAEDLHAAVQAVIHDEIMRHADTMGLNYKPVVAQCN